MKTLLVLACAAACLAAAAPATAVLDPDPDGVGVYFDTAAETVEAVVGANTPFTAYVILTRPARGVIEGMEFHYRLDAGVNSGLVLRVSWALPPDIICVTCSWDPLEDSVRVAYPSPHPATEATVLMTWQYMLLGVFPVEFFLAATPFTGPDTGQLAYLSGGAWYPMHVSSGDPALPVAGVNTTVVGSEDVSFGRIKALYR